MCAERAPWEDFGVQAEMSIPFGGFNPTSIGAFREEKDNRIENQGVEWSGRVRWDTEERRGREQSNSY